MIIRTIRQNASFIWLSYQCWVSQIYRVANKSTGLEQALASALGDRLRELRKESGLTQEQIAERAGIARNTYQDYEIGRNSHGKIPNPTLKTIINIAEAMDISVIELLKPVFPN